MLSTLLSQSIVAKFSSSSLCAFPLRQPVFGCVSCVFHFVYILVRHVESIEASSYELCGIR